MLIFAFKDRKDFEMADLFFYKNLSALEKGCSIVHLESAELYKKRKSR